MSFNVEEEWCKIDEFWYIYRYPKNVMKPKNLGTFRTGFSKSLSKVLHLLSVTPVTHLGGSSAPSKSNMVFHNKWLRFYGKIIVSHFSKSNSRNSCKPHAGVNITSYWHFSKTRDPKFPRGRKTRVTSGYEYLRVICTRLPEFYLQLSFNGPKGCTNSPSY